MHYTLSTWRVVGMEGSHDLLVEKKFGTFSIRGWYKIELLQTYVYGSSM